MAQPLQRSIVHLDADAFFASVEQSADARLRGKPIAVGGEKRGIIASASYEARKFGIYTPMPTALARRLCPKLILLPGDFEKYELFSRLMFSYAYDFTPEVEIGSIDEGYFDLTGVRKSPIDIAQSIRQAIRQSLKLPVSEGIAVNKLVSQIASKLKKPSAFEFVPPGAEAEFLDPLANKWLPGVGPKTATQLNTAGLASIGQVARTPPELLGLLVGNMARQLALFSRGIDERPVVPVRASAKSYGEQETFASDTTDEEFLDATLRRMADKLMAKVRGDEKSIRTIAVKVRYNDMDEQQASESLAEPTDLETDIYSTVSKLLRKAWQRRVSLRLVALRLSNVYEGGFRGVLALDSSLAHHAACERLAGVVDQVRQKFGRHALLRGHDFVLRAKHNHGQEPESPQPAAPASTVGQLQEAAIPYEAKAIQRQRLGNSVAQARPEAKGRQIIVSPGAELKFRFELPPPETPSDPRPGKQQPSVATYPTAPVTPARVSHYARRQAVAVPLNVHSYYSFLDSTLSIRAIIELAQKHELPAIALTDRHNVHGAVEFAQAAVMAGIQPITGAELLFQGRRLCLYAATDRGYHRLCQILSQPPPILPEHLGDTEGLLAVGYPPELASLFPGRFYLATDNPEDKNTSSTLPRAALFPAHYATRTDRWKYDVVQSIRTLTLLRQEHPEKELGGDFHFRPPAELSRLFAAQPEVLRNTQEIAERCSFVLKAAKPQFPSFTPPDGSTPAVYLRKLVMEGLLLRYPRDHARLRPQVEEELAIIMDVGYEEYFLVMWDILNECRRRDIHWITRGSAADSLACYCLGISGVCPIRFDLYFRRFLNKERMAMNKLPDIDVDFPHDRKDDVIDLIFEKYGPEHTAVVGGFSTFQARSAFAEVAKVLGVSDFQVRRITERLPYFCRAGELAEAAAGSLECRDLPLEQEPYATAMEMAAFLDGFPRYAKMHPCGLVLSRQPMMEITPCFTSAKGYPTTHFDMDSVETVGLIKMDILAQGGLAVMRDVRRSLATRNVQLGPPESALEATLPNAEWDFLQPWDDPEVWELIASGGARAVHHIESPAMISLCRMCNVHDIDTLVAIVSVIRPGAANESKKMEFARRYQGLSPVHYPHPSLEQCLRSTYGLVVYEEHILQICEAFATLPPGRADVLRRALGKDKEELIEQIRKEFFDCARRAGRSEPEITEVWSLVVGFKGYAFCKAHSTAYGVEAYQSAWLKRYFPAEFMAAVLANGKGFYNPLVYILECHRLGIPLLPPWINSPGPEFAVENGKIRVPALRVKGLSTHTSETIRVERDRGEFASLVDFFGRVQPLPEEMELLIRAGAFDAFGQSRTAQYWEFRSLSFSQPRTTGLASNPRPRQLWLLPQGIERLPSVPLVEPTRLQKLQWEDELLGFTVSGHPLELHPDIAWETYCPVSQLDRYIGREVVTCGLIVEQRIFHQVTGEPMKFITIADRTGIAETELFAKTYRSFGLNTVRYRVLEVIAVVEPFESGRGWTLRVLRASKPRLRRNPPPATSNPSSAPPPFENCQPP